MQLQEGSPTCYFTKDYEWIRFDDIAAYIGVCDFKLIGLTDIQKIEFIILEGDVKQGQLIANIFSDDYTIPVHMPVDGWVIEINKEFLCSPNKLLRNAQTGGWIAKIQPSMRQTNSGLLHANDYLKKQTSFKAKDMISNVSSVLCLEATSC